MRRFARSDHLLSTGLNHVALPKNRRAYNSLFWSSFGHRSWRGVGRRPRVPGRGQQPLAVHRDVVGFMQETKATRFVGGSRNFAGGDGLAEALHRRLYCIDEENARQLVARVANVV